MITKTQYVKKKIVRRRKYHKKKTPVLKGCPQRKGTVTSVVIESPKKPNSANRKVAKIAIIRKKNKLRVFKKVRAQIPGEHHDLKRYGRVLIRGGRTRDLPGIRCRIIRGKLDCGKDKNRKTSHSKYGLKLFEILNTKPKKRYKKLKKILKIKPSKSRIYNKKYKFTKTIL